MEKVLLGYKNPFFFVLFSADMIFAYSFAYVKSTGLKWFSCYEDISHILFNLNRFWNFQSFSVIFRFMFRLRIAFSLLAHKMCCFFHFDAPLQRIDHLWFLFSSFFLCSYRTHSIPRIGDKTIEDACDMKRDFHEKSLIFVICFLVTHSVHEIRLEKCFWK